MKYKTDAEGVVMSPYSASVPARIPVTVVVVPVVTFAIHVVGALAHWYPHDVFVRIWSALPELEGANSDTVTAHVLPFTLVTAQLSADHSYQLAVFFTTYPVVAVPHGVNSLTVTAPVLPFTLVTASVCTSGTTDVLSLPVLSNTGMLPLDVPVSLLAAVPSFTPLSFMILPVVPSNNTTSPSVELLGQSTSPLQTQSAPSEI